MQYQPKGVFPGEGICPECKQDLSAFATWHLPECSIRREMEKAEVA